VTSEANREKGWDEVCAEVRVCVVFVDRDCVVCLSLRFALVQSHLFIVKSLSTLLVMTEIVMSDEERLVTGSTCGDEQE